MPDRRPELVAELVALGLNRFQAGFEVTDLPRSESLPSGQKRKDSATYGLDLLGGHSTGPRAVWLCCTGVDILGPFEACG